MLVRIWGRRALREQQFWIMFLFCSKERCSWRALLAALRDRAAAKPRLVGWHGGLARLWRRGAESPGRRDRRPSTSSCRRRRSGGRRSPPARPRRPVERLRTLRAAGAHRLRRRLAKLRGVAAVQDDGDDRFDPQDHHAQRFAGHLVRSLDQSLSRLRARLHLLLRAADPRLSRALAGPRFRDQAVREAGRAEAAGARVVGRRLRAAHHRHRHQYRSLPADRARASGDAAHPRGAGPLRPSGRHRDQIGAGPARPRYSRAHGQAQSGQGRAVGDHARWRSSRA